MERRSWRPREGGFEADRRLRTLFGFGAWCALLLFAAGMARIWLSVAVADHSSQVHRLEGEIAQLEVDLSIAADDLEQRRAYAEVISSAQEVGFGRGAHTHLVPIPEAVPRADGMLEQIAEDLQRGSRLILAEALAGEQPWESEIADRR